MGLDYPITRSFPQGWRWFTPLSFVGAFIALVFLCTINVALTGYETVTVFQSDFNATQSFWYNKYMPFRVSTPGTLCDPHVFNVGDPFTTNYTFFEWTIDSITRANAGNSGISYKGDTLNGCDVSSIYGDGDLRTWSVAFTVVIQCQQAILYEIRAKTSFTISFLPGIYSPLLGMVKLDEGSDMRPAVFDALLQAATRDVGRRAFTALLTSNYTSPVAASIQADITPCPMSLGSSAACGLSTPNFTISSAAVVMSDLSFFQDEAPDPITVLDDNIKLPISNLLQTVYAIIRVELGNPSPNNFILHPNVTDNIIVSTFPATPLNQGGDALISGLYQEWTNPDPETKKYLPVTVSGPANIQVVYPCRFQQQKTPGQVFISVLVATSSMFSTGWAVFMVLAVYFAKQRGPSGNESVSRA
ncbi:hypothetical protein K443DRAFT_138164 [Laccaria amethystina LaAM-08-1]|uniref:Transmembrane protein n=1 Tax=Laccaria amethystina LaAM-08-1 TaxID=1095629 RepID=A0A0C9XYT0_9AGAR|nr:hypothetical protein K443DRAFT_138164 [Laccaria amethystina LaAM-08-1]